MMILCFRVEYTKCNNFFFPFILIKNINTFAIHTQKKKLINK